MRLLALVVSLVAAWAITHVGGNIESPRVTALAFGVALIAATLAGALIERLRLPRVTGYLLFGLLCGPYMANVITRSMARELQIVNGVAVALIAFIAGLEMNISRLRPRLPTITRFAGVTIVITYAVLFVSIWAAWPWLGVDPALGGLRRVAVAAVLTTLVASFSPTVSIAVVAEARAEGPFTELSLAIVILADLVLILAFTLIMELVRYAFGISASVGVLASVTWAILGSFAFGAMAGACLALYLTKIGREAALVLLGFCAVLAGVAEHLRLEGLMAALAAGLVVENVAPAAGDVVKHAVERSALPLLIVFFAAAGASLDVGALATLGSVAAALAAWRMLVVWYAARTGRAAAGLDDAVSRTTWMALVSQAGVTLGLAVIVAEDFPAWGDTVQKLMLALIALHQLVGPVLFRHALARAGEVGRLDGATAA